MNTTGYLNNSPHRFNKVNQIPGGNITMNQVDIPLILRPNKGRSIIAMPNSGEYKFPKADFVTETPLANYQMGGTNDCPDGYQWSVADQQCLPMDQVQMSNFTGNRNSFITGAINPSGQRVGGTGAQSYAQQSSSLDENQQPELKRMFGTPNIPAIVGSNLLAFGLSTVANNIEQGKQKAFMLKNMNNPLFNGSYSNAQNDYGTDPYEQTGQLRPTYQKGGRTPITVTNPNDPRLKAYNDSLSLYNGNLAMNNIHSSQDEIKFTNSKLFKDYQKAYNNYQKKNNYIGEGNNNFKKPVQPVVYQKPSLGFLGKGADKKSNDVFDIEGYNKKYPPIYVTDPKDPRISGYAEAGNQYLYKQPKPVERVLNKVEGKAKYTIPTITTGQPTAQAPNFQQAGFDNTKVSPYSYTDANGKYLEQNTTYFPDEQSLRKFAEANKTLSIQSSAKGATATGYIKEYQKGGSFNPIDYLYGDDEENSEKQLQEANKKAKQPRITEEDIDNTDDQLANDILNMTSSVRSRNNFYDNSGNSNYALMYLKHQQGAAGINAIKKAADEGLEEVPRNWNKENIQANMENNVGKDFKGKVTPASFIDYWSGKFNRHMQTASKKQTPYDNVFQQVGEEEGVNPLFLKTVANIESGINPNNNTKSKYKGLFAMNSKTFNGNVFNPYQNTKAAAQNFKRFEQGGEFIIDFNTMRQLKEKGIKFKIIE